MSYDPRACGAQCDKCPLRGSVPVPPDVGHSARICIVGEAPGADEVKEGRPFVGASGLELHRGLSAARIIKRDVHITNVLLCQPPKNELSNLLARISADNRERDKRNKAKKKAYEIAVKRDATLPAPIYEDLIISPIDCCAPRLQREVQGYKDFITLGGVATRAITGSTQSILSLRGGTIDLVAGRNLPERRVMPTVHPAFVLRAPRWTAVFRGDLFRANRWFTGTMAWTPPRVTYNPSPEWLDSFLNQPGVAYWTYDLETDGIEPLTAKIRCVGIGAPDGRVTIVGLLSRDGISRFYTERDEIRVVEIMKTFFTNKKIVKVAHNGGSYDFACLHSQWGIEVAPQMDTIMLHRLVASELPHSLGFVGSVYTDAPSWKTDREGNKIAFSAESDEQLHEYCAMDVRVTSMLLPPLLDSVKTRGQAGLIGPDHRIQKICAEMHRVGMWVDQAKRAEYEKKYVKEAAARLEELRRSSPIADFNPGSPHQIRRLLFDDWNLVAPLDEKERYTASGDPATSDDVLRALLTLPHLTEQQRAFVYGLRKYRKAQKLLGTYIVKLRPSTQSADLGWDEEEEPEDYNIADEEALNLRRRAERETREKYSVERTGIVNPKTGRMYPGYNAHVATCVTPDTWLLTESGPQQIGDLRGFGPTQTETVACGLRLHDGTCFSEVSHLQNPGVCPTIRIQTVLGVTLTATPHHRIHVAQRAKFQWQDSHGKWHPTSPAWQWRRMDELEIGMYVEVPIGMNVWGSKTDVPQVEDRQRRTNANNVTIPSTLTKELAFFVGAYNADGSQHDANGSFTIRLSGMQENIALWRETLDTCVSLFGGEAVRTATTEVLVTSIALAPWATAIGLGRGIENKRCPVWLLSAPREFLVEYLRGLSRDSSTYLAGGVTPVWRYTGTEQLCREVQMLLFNLGIAAALEDVRTDRQPLTWVVLAQAKEASAVADLLGIVLPTPTRQGDTSQKRPKYIHRGDRLWLRITSIEDGGDRQVYDVTIPTTHQFWANGTVSHNTGRLSSSKPINAQNFPKGLRAMVRAAPGHVLIGADADQLELRIASALWGAKRYLAAFAAAADPHSSTALACFGEAFRNAAGFPGGHWTGDLFVPNGEGKWTGEGKTFRDLAKRVQYACCTKGTRVVTSSDAGFVEIQEIKDGTPLWTWSLARNRYEVSKAVGDAKLTGQKRVVRIHLAWGQGNTYRSEMTLTPDHLCMLRDGTWRAAGNLQPGDRLMPFWRFTASSGNGFSYRHLRPFNDGRRVSEHRIVQGFYETGEGDTHVHHKDEDTFNNDPANLEPLDYREHYEIHKEDIDAGRRTSRLWRESVSNPETRRAATQKSWDSGTRKAPVYASILDAYAEHIGVKTDREVAEMAGCTPENVAHYRNKHGIGKPAGQRGGIREQILVLKEKLGVLTDGEIAEMVGCDRTNVARLRESLGIPSAPRKKHRSSSVLDAFSERIGHEPDSVIAAEAGCTPENVNLYRKSRGIPAYWRSSPGADNHVVLAVEEAGVEEVWDIEVDHEDHNFALEAGVFVHNSQYMATVETVHRVICQTETEGKGGKTELPYLNLALSEVRKMHQAWLDGCPEFPAGWDREINEWRRQGYLQEPIDFRRRDFLDGENPNELVNFKIQSSAAALMNRAIIALSDEIPCEKWGPGTGIINQCHDALVLEVPADGAELVTYKDETTGEEKQKWVVPEGSIPWRTMQTLNEVMNQEHPALPGVKITAAADIGLTWKEVG